MALVIHGSVLVDMLQLRILRVVLFIHHLSIMTRRYPNALPHKSPYFPKYLQKLQVYPETNIYQ